MVVTRNGARIHRPETSPVQLRQHGSSCGLAPRRALGGRAAVGRSRLLDLAESL